MKKVAILTTMLLIVLTSGFAQKVDTLYYDLDGKGAPNKDFADIIMMAYYGEDESMNRFRAFYTSGEIYGKGGFASIDKRDVNKSQLKNFELFYKSGKLLKSYKVDGVIEVRKEFYENGNYIRYDSLVNNKAEGMQYYEGSNDGKFIKCIEMKEGNPVNPYYTIWHDGVPCNYYIEDNSICNVEVSKFEMKESIYENGSKFCYYIANGIIIKLSSFTESLSDDNPGELFLIEVENNRDIDIQFSLDAISASCIEETKKEPYILFSLKPDKPVNYMSNLHIQLLKKNKLDHLWITEKMIKPKDEAVGIFILNAVKKWDFIDVTIDGVRYSFPISSKYCNKNFYKLYSNEK